MSIPKETVEEIRKIRFGIGLETGNLTSDQLAAFEDKKSFLSNAAHLLTEINSKKPHFSAR